MQTYISHIRLVHRHKPTGIIATIHEDEDGI